MPQHHEAEGTNPRTVVPNSHMELYQNLGNFLLLFWQALTLWPSRHSARFMFINSHPKAWDDLINLRPFFCMTLHLPLASKMENWFETKTFLSRELGTFINLPCQGLRCLPGMQSVRMFTRMSRLMRQTLWIFHTASGRNPAESHSDNGLTISTLVCKSLTSLPGTGRLHPCCAVTTVLQTLLQHASQTCIRRHHHCSL